MDVRRIEELLGRRTAAISEVTGSVLVRCPACEMLVPERAMAEHARSYDDDRHAAVEVLES